MRFITFCTILLLALVPLGACSDPTGLVAPPNVVEDTISLVLPVAGSVGRHTAIDITVVGAEIGGGRSPELAIDAPPAPGFPPRWDFVLRVTQDGISLAPAAAIGIEHGNPRDRAGLSEPLVGQQFATLREVPRNTRFATDRPTALRTGAVYIARSRAFVGLSLCQQFSKIEALSVDAAAGTVVLRVATNANCGDQRLIVEG